MADPILSPCPFCGGEAELIQANFYGSKMTSTKVVCKNQCHAIDEDWWSINDEEKAIKVWNDRIYLKLLKASISLVERWDTPLWKDVPSTAEYVNDLRKAISLVMNEKK